MIQTNPHGRKVDTHRDEAPRFPFAPGVIEGPDQREGTLDDPIRRINVLAACFWIALCGFSAASLAWLIHAYF